MKIEVGKFYKTRSGKKAIVDYISSDKTLKYGAVCRIIGRSHFTSFSVNVPDGCFNATGKPHELDLVEEWKEPMKEKLKLEVGKTYITQIGAKVRIIADDFKNCGANYVGILTRANESESLYTYFEDGTLSGSTTTQSNLVLEYSPWSDVKVDTVVYVGVNKAPYHFAKYEDGICV